MAITQESLLNEILKTAQNLTKRIEIDALRRRTIMIIQKIFGSDSDYIKSINSIRFSPSITYSGMDSSQYLTAFDSGKVQFCNTIRVMIEDLQLSKELEKTTPVKSTNDDSLASLSSSNKVFIVHGHNEAMKQSMARFIEKIHLDPIILHEQANLGKTIIEKFTDNSDVSFAIVLLSADDLAIPKDENLTKGKLRARQNVILELGFFLGKLGREKVIVMYEVDENFEFPSDYQGVIYIPFDQNDNWRFAVLKEMKGMGHTVDANILI